MSAPSGVPRSFIGLLQETWKKQAESYLRAAKGLPSGSYTPAAWLDDVHSLMRQWQVVTLESVAVARPTEAQRAIPTAHFEIDAHAECADEMLLWLIAPVATPVVSVTPLHTVHGEEVSLPARVIVTARQGDLRIHVSLAGLSGLPPGGYTSVVLDQNSRLLASVEVTRHA